MSARLSFLLRSCERCATASFINFLRIREWQDLFTQLREMGRTANIRVSNGRDIDASGREVEIHKSLLSGLLSHVGAKEEREKTYGKAPAWSARISGGTRYKFAIFPGSGLFKQNPDWVLSAELVETSRLWARTNAAIGAAVG